MLQARFLGRYDICIDGQPVSIPSRPAQALLAYLLMHPNRTLRREMLAGIFWPEAAEPNARSNLRHALWRIRKALGEGCEVRLTSDDLGVKYLPQPEDQLDVTDFEACLEDKACTDELIKVMRAHGGELLPGFYDEWVTLARQRIQAAYERKLEILLEGLLAERRWTEALEWGQEWIALGGVPEPAYRALMLAQAGLGNLAGAASQYQRCVEALHNELGVEPSERTRKTFEQIRGGEIKPVLLEPIASPEIQPAIFKEPDQAARVFVGREVELSALEGYLDKALRGQAQVVFVKGEAGSGKTSLLQGFVRQAQAKHAELAVGWGICNAFYGLGDPYLPFRDVLDILAGGNESLYLNGTLARSQVTQMRANFPAAIQALLEQAPDLINTFLNRASLAERAKSILPDGSALSQQLDELSRPVASSTWNLDNATIFEQYTQAMRRLARVHPVLIVLDDLQWMDPGSSRLLFHITRRMGHSRILIAGAYRSEEVALGRNGARHPLEPLLNELQAAYGEITIDLDQSSEMRGKDFIEALLETEPNRLDRRFRQELHRQTRGHPLFTIQLLRNLQERGEMLPDDQGQWIASQDLNWGNLPPQVEGIIGERIGRLERELQALLLAASVEGEQFSLQVLERVQGKPQRELLQQLSRELENRHRLVQEVGDLCVGAHRLVHFRFTHSLIQQYLYNSLGAAERASLHKEIAEALESLYQEDTTNIALHLAQHYQIAGVREKAVKYLLQVGDQRRGRYAHQEAIEAYQQALVYLKEIGDNEQIARTLMKLYLVYHTCFDFEHAQEMLEAYQALWQKSSGNKIIGALPASQVPYRLAVQKTPNFDPALCETLFDLEWIKEMFCGLVEWSEDRNVIPLAAKYWEVLEGGRRYIFHLREDLKWSDGEPVTAGDFEFAWKRLLDPSTQALASNLLYDVRGAKDFNQGRVIDAESVGIKAIDTQTLVVDLEEPCGHFPYILGDPITFAVPRHVVERVGKAWTQPGNIVTNAAFTLESWEQPLGKVIEFTRNSHYFGKYNGNIERVKLTIHQNEVDIYQSFLRGELDMVEFLIPQIPAQDLKHYRETGQLHMSHVPFVDAIYFLVDKPPFDREIVRRAFILATDREKLANEIENQLPASGGYIPPGLPGYSADIGLQYDPDEARRILAAAGYPGGERLPTIGLLMGLVGLERSDNLVFDCLQEMWEANLGVRIQKRWNEAATLEFNARQDFNLFFIGWLADYPDPASFLQTNYLIDQCHWKNPTFEALIQEGQRMLDQGKRVELYRQADRIITESAVVLPLFYGHIFELRQPWLSRLSGSSIYNPQWKDIILRPH